MNKNDYNLMLEAYKPAAKILLEMDGKEVTEETITTEARRMIIEDDMVSFMDALSSL